MKSEKLCSVFPEEIQKVLSDLSIKTEDIQEIRIRAEKPLIIYTNGREIISSYITSSRQLKEILAYLGNYSLYAYEDEIRQGFLSFEGGHRVGIAGKVVIEQKRVKTIIEISSLNIRFAHEIKGCADKILPYLWDGENLCSALIVSAPACGKTTLLRDCIRQISNGNSSHRGKNVGVVDERLELSGSFRGVSENDLGIRTDILSSCPKAEGMMMLIRSMAPEVLAVDEIGSLEDLSAMQYAINCGCVFLATVHGSSFEELLRKPVLKEMLEQAFFQRFVFLKSGKKVGQIQEILDGTGVRLYMEGSVC